MPFIALALVIAATLGSGVAAAADQALPGNVLWGFKVTVNEGLAGVLASTDAAHAEWDLSTIKTRLGEAQALAAKGQLTAGAQADIAANIAVHANSLNNSIAKLQTDGDVRGAANLAARYQADLATATDVGMPAQGTLTSTLEQTLQDASSLSASVSAAAH